MGCVVVAVRWGVRVFFYWGEGVWVDLYIPDVVGAFGAFFFVFPFLDLWHVV